MPADNVTPVEAPDAGALAVGSGFGLGVETGQLPSDVIGSEPTAAPRRRLGWFFWVCVGWLALVIFGAIFASVLPIPAPNLQDAAPSAMPSIHHWLGTDSLGRDLFARVVVGARVSLVVGFGSIAIGVAVGGFMGLLAGFLGGRADTVLTALANVALAFPALILLLAVVAFLGANLFNITLTVGVLSIAPIFRVVRGATVAFADLEFVTAARGIGASRWRILFREIVPNVVPIVMSYSLVFVAVSILAEAALSYLGLSVADPTATWGKIVNGGQAYLATDPYICLWPSVALFLTVLALNLVGDRLRTLFDVREAKL